MVTFGLGFVVAVFVLSLINEELRNKWLRKVKFWQNDKVKEIFKDKE